MTQGGYGDLDANCRMLIRQALNAQIKHPIQNEVQLFDRQANNMILCLNSYVMSCLPPATPARKRNPTEIGLSKLNSHLASQHPISSMDDVHERLDEYRLKLEGDRRQK